MIFKKWIQRIENNSHTHTYRLDEERMKKSSKRLKKNDDNDDRDDVNNDQTSNLLSTTLNGIEANKFAILPSMRITRSVCLNQMEFKSNIRIIGQVRKQIILVVLLNRQHNQMPLMLAFDQHAIHERIRYEQIYKTIYEDRTGFLKTKTLVPPMEMSIELELVNRIIEKRSILQRVVGLHCDLKTNKETKTNDKQSCTKTLLIYRIPTILTNYHDPSTFLMFLNDSLKFIDGRESMIPMDKILQRYRLSPFLLEQVKSLSCHGAIRFGEPLSRMACVQLIQTLAQCQQPFRCAHGRLSAIPIIHLPLSTSNVEKRTISVNTITDGNNQFPYRSCQLENRTTSDGKNEHGDDGEQSLSEIKLTIHRKYSSFPFRGDPNLK